MSIGGWLALVVLVAIAIGPVVWRYVNEPVDTRELQETLDAGDPEFVSPEFSEWWDRQSPENKAKFMGKLGSEIEWVSKPIAPVPVTERRVPRSMLKHVRTELSDVRAADLDLGEEEEE